MWIQQHYTRIIINYIDCIVYIFWMESVVTTASWTIVLIGLFLITTSIEAQQFTIEPESVVQAEGLLAEFKCLSPGAISHPWFVNGVEATSPDSSSEIRVAEGTSGRPSVLTIPASSQFNSSVIQCAAVSLSGGVLSRNSTLIVERVHVSIEILNDETNIIVSVTNNFTMNILAFRVDISLTTLGTNEKVTLPSLNGGQNQVQFNYEQTKNHTVCDIFTFTVTPISDESGMEGNKSEPVTGFFTTVTDNNNVTPLISQGKNVLRKIVHLGGMVPNCIKFTSYQVTSDILAPINKTIKNPQMINVSLPTDKIIKISVTFTSIMGVRLRFKDMLIKTTDVQNLIVDVCPKENCARIEYVEGTLSPGALVCVIRIIDGVLDFQSIRLVPIRRNMSNNFTIPVVHRGKYRVLAFDLENNNMSVPRIPMSVVADNETMFLSNESSTKPISSPNSEDITVTKLSNGAEVTCNTSGHSCLALFQSKTSPTFLDPMVMIGLIEPPKDRTTITLNASSDVYVVVYTWNSDSGETIFDGKVSFISLLELPTSPPPTQSPPDTTESLPPSPLLVVLSSFIVLIIPVILIVILYRVKKGKRGSKVFHSSCNHHQLERGRSTNTAYQELDVGVPIASREEVIALYDIARPENMSLGWNTANTDDTPPPGYDVVRIENMPSPEYESVASANTGKPTPTTNDNPPPLPPPMIRRDSDAPDLPPPYNPAVDSKSVVDLSVQSSINYSVENVSVDREVDESLKRDLSVSNVGTTEEAIGSTKTQPNNREMGQIIDVDVDCVNTVQGAEDGAGNSADRVGQEAMITAQDVGTSIISQDQEQVILYDVACLKNMSPECNTVDTDDTLPPGYDVVCKENMQAEYETVSLVLAGKPTFTGENPPLLPPLMIQRDEDLDNDGVLTEEATGSTSQAKDEPTEDRGDGEHKHQYMLVVPKQCCQSSGLDHGQLDRDRLIPVDPPPAQGLRSQYTLIETKPASSDAKVMDSTKVVYVQIDKDKLKPVDPNDPPVEANNQQIAEDYAISDSDDNQSNSYCITYSKAVPPKQEKNNLNDPQLIDSLPIDESNQLSVNDCENDESESKRQCNRLPKPKVAKTQGLRSQYTLVETKPASSDAKVMDSTKVTYDKDKLKPVDPNDPPALPPRCTVITNTGELHTEKTL